MRLLHGDRAQGVIGGSAINLHAVALEDGWRIQGVYGWESTNLRITEQEIEGHVGPWGYSLKADGDVYSGLSSRGFFPVVTVVHLPPVQLPAGWSSAEFAFWVALLLGGHASGDVLTINVDRLIVKCSLRAIGLTLGERRVIAPRPTIQPPQHARLAPNLPGAISSHPRDRAALVFPLQAPEPAHLIPIQVPEPAYFIPIQTPESASFQSSSPPSSTPASNPAARSR